MKLSIKIAIAIFIIGVVLIGLRIYVGFNGNPIAKHKISLEEKAYAEKKYDMKTKMVDSYFNWKEGSYCTTLKEENSSHRTFIVFQTIEEGGKEVFKDTLPEATWGNEIKNQTLTTLQMILNDATKIDIYVETGMDYKIPDSNEPYYDEIPPYSSMKDVPYTIDITLKNTKLTEKEYSRILKVIKYLRTEKLTCGDLFFRYNDDLAETVAIAYWDNPNIKSINSVADIKQLHK